MPQDPIKTLINLIQANLLTITYPTGNPNAGQLIVTKDDGVTSPNVLVTSQWFTDTMFETEGEQFDGIVTVTILTDPITPSGFGVEQEDHLITADINCWAMNKYAPLPSGATSGTSTLVITDEIMRYKLAQAIDAIINANQKTQLAYGIEHMHVHLMLPMDETPTEAPAPLVRRYRIEVELFMPTLTSLAQ